MELARAGEVSGDLSEHGEIWIEVGRFPGQREAEQNALVLVAAGVATRLVPSVAGIGLFVSQSDAARARTEILAYAKENAPTTTGIQLRPFRDVLDAALLYSVVLVAIHAMVNRDAFGVDWLEIGHAQASLIKSGEWWRAITALGLHADLGHLLSNIVAGGILGMLVAQIVGPGLGWFAILLGGGAANMIVAVLAPNDHAAIGASTAVFAALGLLAALALGHQQMPWRGLRRWRPIGAAIMLLALLGVGGEHVDVGAHVAGLGAGLIGGAALFLARPFVPTKGPSQLLYGTTAVAIFALAWLLALARA